MNATPSVRGGSWTRAGASAESANSSRDTLEPNGALAAGAALTDYPSERQFMNANNGAIGWGTLTLINAGLAQGKGRSGLAWWLLSLFLGPVATLLIVVLPAQSMA